MEEFKPVLGFNGVYEVSNLGRVKSYFRYKRGIFLKPGLSGNGYLTVCLANGRYRKSYCIQILVLEAFVCERPYGMFGLHNDANRTNNNLENLRWGTPSDNAQDQIKNGTYNFNKGEGHQLSVLKNNDVIEIRRLLNEGLTHRVIAEKFGVKQQAISKIKLGLRWSHLR